MQISEQTKSQKKININHAPTGIRSEMITYIVNKRPPNFII